MICKCGVEKELTINNFYYFIFIKFLCNQSYIKKFVGVSTTDYDSDDVGCVLDTFGDFER